MEKSDKKRVNILYVYPNLKIGGAQELMLTIFNNINKDKFGIYIFSFEQNGEIAKEIESLNGKIFYLRTKRKSCNPQIIFELMKIIRNQNIHIVHTNLFHANSYGRLAAYLSRVPVIIMTEHGGERPKCLKDRIMDWFFARVTDTIIAVSEFDKEYYSKNEKIAKNKFEVIYNCIDTTKFQVTISKQKVKEKNNFKSGDIIIGTIGSLSERKSQKFLLDAVAKILNSFPEIKVVIVGSGPLKDLLKERAEELGISENVFFLGVRRDIPELLRMMDIFVLPSIHESFGIVLLEAMYSSLPVVASNIEGIPEVVDNGVTGILVPPQDTVAFADALPILLKDNRKRHRMGKLGREKVSSQFTAERFIAQLERLYERLLISKRYAI